MPPLGGGECDEVSRRSTDANLGGPVAIRSVRWNSGMLRMPNKKICGVLLQRIYLAALFWIYRGYLELSSRFRASLGVHVSPFVRAEVEIWPKNARNWALQDGFLSNWANIRS